MARKATRKRPKGSGTLDDLLDAAIEIIDPPDNSVELCRARVGYYIDLIKKNREVLRAKLETSPAVVKKALADYAEQLRKAKKMAGRLTYFGLDKFSAELDTQIRRVEHIRDSIEVKHGSRQWSLPAQLSIQAAYELLVLDDPSWRQKPTLTVGGPWHKLSSLMYEALTGEHERDLSKYLRAWSRNIRVRYLARSPD
jgi:hypothetical protein